MSQHSDGTSRPHIFIRLSPSEPSEVFDSYWRFAAERQAIFFKRVLALPPPWTHDPILEKYKFTNAYRASDRTSQFLVKHVIYRGVQTPEEVFFRTILFKLFNRIETWQLLEASLGSIQWADYEFPAYDAVLSGALASGIPIYSAAYIMPSGRRWFGEVRKHQNHLRLLEHMMQDEVPCRFFEMRSMREAFELLRSYPMIGDFLAYQFTTDLNYSQLSAFSEMEFVIPGPGARDGIRKCFRKLGGLHETDIIELTADRQEREFERLALSFQSLWGRPLQLIDCQNVFCEVGKYARLAHPNVKGTSKRTHLKQLFRPREAPLTLWYPPKWGLNLDEHRVV